MPTALENLQSLAIAHVVYGMDLRAVNTVLIVRDGRRARTVLPQLEAQGLIDPLLSEGTIKRVRIVVEAVWPLVIKHAVVPNLAAVADFDAADVVEGVPFDALPLHERAYAASHPDDFVWFWSTGPTDGVSWRFGSRRPELLHNAQLYVCDDVLRRQALAQRQRQQIRRALREGLHEELTALLDVPQTTIAAIEHGTQAPVFTGEPSSWEGQLQHKIAAARTAVVSAQRTLELLEEFQRAVRAYGGAAKLGADIVSRTKAS